MSLWRYINIETWSETNRNYKPLHLSHPGLGLAMAVLIILIFIASIKNNFLSSKFLQFIYFIRIIDIAYKNYFENCFHGNGLVHFLKVE